LKLAELWQDLGERADVDEGKIELVSARIAILKLKLEFFDRRVSVDLVVEDPRWLAEFNARVWWTFTVR